MSISRSFDYIGTCRQLLQSPGTIRLLTEIYESNGKIQMLAQTNEKLLSGLEVSRRFRDAEAFCRISELGVSETRLKALIHGRANPKGLQKMALIYWRILNEIPKFNGDSNPPRLQEKDILSVDLFSAAARESVGGGSQSDSDYVPDLRSVIAYYHQTKNGEQKNKLIIADLIASFNDAVSDDGVDPLLAILCFVTDYHYVQRNLRGQRQYDSLLLMYLLNRYGFLCVQYSSIETAFERRRIREEVIAFAESAGEWGSRKYDYFPGVTFLLETILAVYRDILNQLKPVLEDGLSRNERILRFIENHTGNVSKREIVEAHSDFSLKTIERHLNNLTEDGRILKFVSGRDVEFGLARDNNNPESLSKNDPVPLWPDVKAEIGKDEGFMATFSKPKKEQLNQTSDLMKPEDPASTSSTKKKRN